MHDADNSRLITALVDLQYVSCMQQTGRANSLCSIQALREGTIPLLLQEIRYFGTKANVELVRVNCVIKLLKDAM